MEEPNKEEVKMAGYLEKKGKMKVMAVWKQYWFVLEGHLLLYYRSQLEYLNLSACKGSLNMGLASSIRPGLSRPNIIEVVTPTKIITLKAKDRSVQEQWLQALLDSLATPPTARISTGPMQLRYSLDNLPTASNEVVSNGDRPLIARRDSVLNRIRRLGGRSYAGGSLETVVRKPKLPKGQAVSRMLALQEPEACSTCDSVTTETRDENQNGDKVSEDPEGDYYYVENKLYNKAQYQETDNALYNLKVDTKDAVKEEESAAKEYYDSYDPVATVGRCSPSPEPDLPPRPRTFSNEDSPETKEEDAEYVDCSEMAGKKPDKKPAKKKVKVKLNKAKVKAESDTEKKEQIPYIKKRRMSFLKKVLGHYRKKNHSRDGDAELVADGNAEEPAYETVDFVVADSSKDSNEGAAELSSPTPAATTATGISPVGKHSLMPNNALLELENKLQGRHTSEQTQIAQHNMLESVNGDAKIEGVDDNLKSDEKTTPPQLPRRQSETRRPSSPWHDVPTNNSPVDGKSPWTSEQRDSLLGTPQGFALLKSRWQAVEKGGEWSRDQAANESQILELYSKVNKKPKTLPGDSVTNDPDPSPGKGGGSGGPPVADKSSATSLIFQMDMEDTESGNFQQDSLASRKGTQPQSPTSKEVVDRVPELPAKRNTLEVVVDGKDARYSNELNNLLAQLVQITSAPLMVPGNTTSLVDFPPSKLSEADEQLLLMAPVRRRRFSEPDYDVPRSHRYIFDSSADSKDSSAPLLEEDSSSCSVSMAPDSLEPLPPTKDT